MKGFWLLIGGIVYLAGMAHAYDPPEIITVIEPDSGDYCFAHEFCCIGDQNADACAELLLSTRNGDQNNYTIHTNLYYGSENMDGELDLQFMPLDQFRVVGNRINFIGRISDEQQGIWGLNAWDVDSIGVGRCYLNLYQGGEGLDNEPEQVLTKADGKGFVIGSGINTRPTDLNGDGYNDLITFQIVDTISLFQVYFGGEELDTIPDWQVTLLTNLAMRCEYSSGYDVNGDGYDDILLRTCNSWRVHPTEYWYHLYLGGDPMDTSSVWEFNEYDLRRHGEEFYWFMRRGFTLLPDVNDDGYDDWGIYYLEFYFEFEDDGYFVFFGSEEPDTTPDLDLQGFNNLAAGDGDGYLAGGDFNGDGIGDIVTNNWGGDWGDGVIHLHFGSRWIDENPDLSVNCRHIYGDRYDRVGAVGDYNGDKIDDFVIAKRSRVLILAGNGDWRVEAPAEDHPPEMHQLSLTAFPNPFNRTVSFRFTLTREDLVRLSVYDVNGRLVARPLCRKMAAGRQTIEWQHNVAGIYFAILSVSGQRTITKVLCLP